MGVGPPQMGDGHGRAARRRQPHPGGRPEDGGKRPPPPAADATPRVAASVTPRRGPPPATAAGRPGGSGHDRRRRTAGMVGGPGRGGRASPRTRPFALARVLPTSGWPAAAAGGTGGARGTTARHDVDADVRCWADVTRPRRARRPPPRLPRTPCGGGKGGRLRCAPRCAAADSPPVAHARRGRAAAGLRPDATAVARGPVPGSKTSPSPTFHARRRLTPPRPTQPR